MGSGFDGIGGGKSGVRAPAVESGAGIRGWDPGVGSGSGIRVGSGFHGIGGGKSGVRAPAVESGAGIRGWDPGVRGIRG